MSVNRQETHLDGTTLSSYKFILASLVSGAFWGLVGVLIGKRLGNIIFGGVLFAPIIGLVVGVASRFVYRRSIWNLLPWSILTLYTGVTAFALAMGAWDVMSRMLSGWLPGTFIEVIAHAFQPASGALWIVTLRYLPYLWPLSWINHILLRALFRRIK